MKTVYPIICQIVNVIPHQFIAEAAKSHKVLSRTFTPKSHVASMLYCQVSNTESQLSVEERRQRIIAHAFRKHGTIRRLFPSDIGGQMTMPLT